MERIGNRFWPDRSLETASVIREAVWITPDMGWSLQTVVDLAITFCRNRGFSRDALNERRLKRQIQDAVDDVYKHSERPWRYESVFSEEPQRLDCHYHILTNTL